MTKQLQEGNTMARIKKNENRNAIAKDILTTTATTLAMTTRRSLSSASSAVLKSLKDLQSRCKRKKPKPLVRASNETRNSVIMRLPLVE